MTEQELTNKIIKNANKQAAALIEDAQNQAQAKLAAAKQTAAERREAALQKGKKDAAIQAEQLKKANEVEMIKARINARQAVMSQAFNQVRDNLLHASNADIKKIVNALVQKYAAPKDTVLVAREWAKAMPNLKATDAITGGIIIENPTYRLELSLDVLLANLREDIELEVAQILGVI